MWYICAVNLKCLVIPALLLAMLHTEIAARAQTSDRSDPDHQALPLPNCSESPTPCTKSRDAKTQSEESMREGNPTQITVASAPISSPNWPLHERIAWAASVILAILGYAGIMLAISTLRKIERLTKSGEAASAAAAECAHAALLHAQAILDSERPWILITVRPAQNLDDNSFEIVATNRGRGPARIVSTRDEVVSAADEASLPSPDGNMTVDSGAPLDTMILLPGELSVIRSFGREDVHKFCKTGELLERVESWEEKIFIRGKVTYESLVALADRPTYSTSWCCWHIHGTRKDGLVITGRHEHNLHN
jgi:hypothetical protein